MSTNHTQNYSLNQWEKSDKVQMEDFNADNAKIDAALAAHGATLSTHTAQIARLGNCIIYTTTYTGTGEFGPDHPNTLTFPKKPLLIYATQLNGGNAQFTAIQGVTAHEQNNFSWSGNSVSWYSTINVVLQLNHQTTCYGVVALLKAD